MTKLRIVSVLAAAVLAMALFAAVASAQGVTVFTGTVTLNGAAAPAGTAVNVTLQDGTVIGIGTTTGANGLAADQYRIDIQATAALENQTVNINAVGSSQTVQATAVFNANRVLTVNLDAIVPPTPTPIPTPTLPPVRGDQGPPGRDGLNGINGTDGADGADGAAGAAGAAGINGTDGADGAAGVAGPRGPLGPAGAEGDDGSSIIGMIGIILGAVALVGAGGAVMMAMGNRRE